MRRYFFLLISIFILLSATTPGIIKGNFVFVFDMGRDLLWTRNMVELKKPTLIGPWGSVAGVYFSPYWYYLLAIPYILFHGDPRGAIIVPLVSNIAATIIGWRYLRKEKHPLAADIFALVFAASPMIVNLSSFAFHANLLPLAFILFLTGLANHKLPLSALAASLTYSLEPAAAAMLTLFLTIFIVWRLAHRDSLISVHSLILTLLLFAMPFLPQFIFEIRHQFIQTQSLIAYFTGQNTSLGGSLPLLSRIPDRIDKFSTTLSYSLFPVETNWIKWILTIIFIFLAIIFVKNSRKKTSNLINRFIYYSLVFILFHYLAYVFIFPAELKGWYLSGFAFVYIFAFSVFIENIIRKILQPTSGLVYFGLFLLVFHNLNPIQRLSRHSGQPPAPETFQAQLEIVDWIYQDALPQKQPFAVYTYTPPIYDYNYQYLIWWRGQNKYHLLPAEFSYLPNKNDYLPNMSRFASHDWLPPQTQLVYAIMEPEQGMWKQKDWLDNFKDLEIVNTNVDPSGLTVIKMKK